MTRDLGATHFTYSRKVGFSQERSQWHFPRIWCYSVFCAVTKVIDLDGRKAGARGCSSWPLDPVASLEAQCIL